MGRNPTERRRNAGLVSESFNPNEYRMAIRVNQSEFGNGNQFTSFESVVEKIASIAKGVLL
jgi:hypothetical protein